MIQQMHERKGSAEQQERPPARLDFAQTLDRGLQLKRPSTILCHLSNEGRVAGAPLAPDGLEHVHQGGVRRLGQRRGEDC